jgi:hypothetical protein
MIRDFDVRRRGDALLLGMAVDHAVLDVATSAEDLRECLAALDAPQRGFADVRLGQFGGCPVRVNLYHDGSVSVMVDGPEFEPTRSQVAGIWTTREELRHIIHCALSGA